jgi:alkylresorcinol/alkylpyrone synthase
MTLTVTPLTHGAPRLTGAATAAPSLTIAQTDAKAAARVLFAGMPGLDRLLSVFDHAGVEVRQVVMPAAELIGRTAPSLRHQDYVRCALPLLVEASRAALTQAGVKASEITHVVLVSSTGLANPTLDVRLAPELGLSPGVRRVPLWGLGCGGGAQGLSVAADLARSAPGARVLLMLVELCSLTLVPTDLTPGNRPRGGGRRERGRRVAQGRG